MLLDQWATRWGIRVEAIRELELMLGANTTVHGVKKTNEGTEARVQSEVRLAAPKHNAILWRNNCGAFNDGNRLIRYGLANDSANLPYASSDLIGITQITIAPEHLGQTLGVFTSYEIKKPDWVYTGNKREVRQKNWIMAVIAKGGFARFVTKVSEVFR